MGQIQSKTQKLKLKDFLVRLRAIYLDKLIANGLAYHIKHLVV